MINNFFRYLDNLSFGVLYYRTVYYVFRHYVNDTCTYNMAEIERDNEKQELQRFLNDA